MRIAPLYTTKYFSPKFTSTQDLADKLKSRLSQGLSSLSDSDDEFVPAAPTQPIVIKEVKIYKKGGNNTETLAAASAGGAGGVGISKISKRMKDSNASSPNSETLAENEDNNSKNNIDYNKITEESVKETRINCQDDCYETSDYNDEDDMDTSCDDIDDGEE